MSTRDVAMAEPPELALRIRHVGSILLAAATAFFFVAFLFAFFYLRALNSNGLWGGGKPHHHVHASITIGIVILLCVLAGAAALRFAVVDVGNRMPAALTALGLGTAVIVLQIVQYAILGFGPGDGGYASVYLGWTGFYSMTRKVACGCLIVALAFVMLLLGLVAALGALLPSLPSATIATQVAAGRPCADPVETQSELAGASLFWNTLVLVEVAAFVLLFIVK